VALTHFIVVEIVCRGDLDAPCAKLHIDIIISNDADCSISQWQINGFSNKVRIALIIGMDEGLSDAVHKVFIQLYNEGLIYRGKRLVNWDPVLRTAVSDLEVISTEEQGSLRPNSPRVMSCAASWRSTTICVAIPA
jgi:hypothetical protein